MANIIPNSNAADSDSADFGELRGEIHACCLHVRYDGCGAVKILYQVGRWVGNNNIISPLLVRG